MPTPKNPCCPTTYPRDHSKWWEQTFSHVDYYSRYFEMERLTSCTCSNHQTQSAFARHGIAEKVISDNGPCYSSEEFHRFADASDHHKSALPTEKRPRRKDCPDSEAHPGQGQSWKQRPLPRSDGEQEQSSGQPPVTCPASDKPTTTLHTPRDQRATTDIFLMPLTLILQIYCNFLVNDC